MRNLTETELLNLWESCMDKPLIETSLHLIATASSDHDLSGVASLSIGQRDARLLQLREWMFGTRLKNVAECPHCSEKIEWENEVKDLRLQPLLPGVGKIYDVKIDAYNISFRLPTSHDLLHLKQSSPKTPANELLNRCINSISKENERVITSDLPVNIIEKINDMMSKEDPQADITMLVACPSCKSQWESGFDILSYLWAEINSWAKQILQEIFILAKFFGWSEREILEIGSKRRKLYLEMVRA